MRHRATGEAGELTAIGRGLTGPPCPQRPGRSQSSPDGRPRQAMCVECGRVTARRTPDGLPRCAGTFAWLGSD